MVLRRLTASLTALLLMTFVAIAAADASEDWQSGQQAFAAGDFSSALLFFQTARDSGISGPAVHYNIAVCEFELGSFDDARETFRLIAEQYPRMRGLAEYNMGLSEYRLGNNVAAQRHFINAYRHSPDDEKLRALSAAKLQALEPEEPASWFGSIGLRVGHDDNVALRDSLGLPAGVTAESPMADLFATVRGSLPHLQGLMLDGSAYAIAYSDADDFDQTEFRFGGLYVWTLDDWRFEGGAHYVYGTLGGSGFERDYTLSARAVRRLSDQASLDLRYRYDDIDNASTEFSGIAGSRQRFDMRYRWYSGRQSLVLRFGLESNDRRDAGVSPSRKRLQADYRYRLQDAWGIEAGIGYRTSDYDDLLILRSEDLVSITLALTRTVAVNWLVALRYQYSENDSSDPDFSYERNLITLGMLRSF